MHKISTKEIFSFCLCLSTFLFPGFGDNILMETSLTSSVLSSLIGFIIGFIPILIIIKINKNINESILEYNKHNFKILGPILNILLLICIISIAFISSWIMLNFVISQFLTRNSYYVFAIILFSIIAYAVIKDKEVMGRTNLALIFILTIIIILSYLFLIPKIDIENFFPIIETTKTNILKASIYYSLLSTAPMMLILIIDNNDIVDKNNYNKNIIKSYLSGSLITIGFIIFIIGVFGIDIAHLTAYPEYTVFKKIKLFNFIERVENIISVIIFISFFGGFSYLIYSIKKWFKITFNIKKKTTTNIIIIIVALIIPILSIYFFKNTHNHDIYMNFPIILEILFIIFTIILILTTIKKKRN